MELFLYVTILLVLVTLDLLATRAVLRDEFSEPRQKVLQLCIIWILPLFGALLVLAVHRQPEKPSGKYRESQDDGDDYGASGMHVRRITQVLDGD